MSDWHNALDTFTVGGLTAHIFYDEDCTSPRDNDNLGTIVGWHRNYCLGDEQPRLSPDAWLAAWKKDNPDWRRAVILPISMYEHAGVALSISGVGQFSDRWDAGHVGWIYALPARIRQDHMCKRITAKVRANVVRVLAAEVAEYGQYINGECYGYTVTDTDGEEVDACWGFVGYAWVNQAATEAAQYRADSTPKQRTLGVGK